MRLVGRTAECEATQRAYASVALWLHRVPLLVTAVSGYLAIAIVAVRVAGYRRSE
jgi:hypothetical protein